MGYREVVELGELSFATLWQSQANLRADRLWCRMTQQRGGPGIADPAVPTHVPQFVARLV